jgi:hypothetical protein
MLCISPIESYIEIATISGQRMAQTRRIGKHNEKAYIISAPRPPTQTSARPSLKGMLTERRGRDVGFAKSGFRPTVAGGSRLTLTPMSGWWIRFAPWFNTTSKLIRRCGRYRSVSPLPAEPATRLVHRYGAKGLYQPFQ